MQATITIKSVNVKKSGETNGKTWTLYEVDAGDKQFSTLDPAWLLFAGDTVTVEYEVQTNGRYTNYRLGDAPARTTAAPVVVPAAAPVPPDKFTVLNEKLDRVLAELAAIRTELAAVRRHFA